MKSASAMKYGGELVDAVDCDYDSFKELIPLCPNCKEPVFIRIGGQRESAKGKAYQIGPHWCHFKGISAEQVAGCELRVNGYTEKDRAKIANQARGQRLKLLQRWFWDVIYKHSHVLLGEKPSEAIKKLDKCCQLFDKPFLNFLEMSREDWYLQERYAVTNSLIQSVVSGDLMVFPTTHKMDDGPGHGIYRRKGKSFDIKKEFVFFGENQFRLHDFDWGSESERAIQKKMAAEAVDFFYSKSNTQIALDLLRLGAWEVIDWADQNPWWHPPGFRVVRPSESKLVIIPPMEWDVVTRVVKTIKSSKGFGHVNVSDRERAVAIGQWSWLYQVAAKHAVIMIASIPWASEFQRLEAEAKQRKGAA